jgi:alkanesulfonate monooxygenase SsuD/methylene tetrahydromethanopterin reductase-like flavin-dependent oxidoreductase (luciferase family)
MSGLRYAIDVCPLGELADPVTVVRLAVAAEAADWDGLSIWDSLGTSMGTASADPFVTLAAVASATSRLRLITSVLALPRRRPQLVAQAAASLDCLSHGRLTLGMGSGADPGDFEPFGEQFDAVDRAARLDAGLGQIDGFLREKTIGPASVQLPRPPIWIGGMSQAALRRAARWDGWIAIAVSEDGSSLNLPAARLERMCARIRDHRATLGGGRAAFDVAVFAFSEPDQAELVRGFMDAGATWWLESLSLMRGSVAELLRRIEAGPPRP